MCATARFSMQKSSTFTPGFVVPKKHVVRRVHAMQVKAFKENSQLQDWRIKDMVDVGFDQLISIVSMMTSFLFVLLGCHH